jgi:hypothetical protein
MVKAKEFWDYLCNTLGYRFFSGIPCLEFKELYSTMSSSIMHYIPAADISVALGIASGVSISGMKSCVLLHKNELYDVLNIFHNFNSKYEIPVLLIVYCDDDLKILSSNKIPYTVVDSENFQAKLKAITNKLENKKTPHAVVIKGEVEK